MTRLQAQERPGFVVDRTQRSLPLPVIPEADIWPAALLMVKRYKADAMLRGSGLARSFSMIGPAQKIVARTNAVPNCKAAMTYTKSSLL
jgi:hypothetical protein